MDNLLDDPMSEGDKSPLLMDILGGLSDEEAVGAEMIDVATNPMDILTTDDIVVETETPKKKRKPKATTSKAVLPGGGEVKVSIKPPLPPEPVEAPSPP